MKTLALSALALALGLACATDVIAQDKPRDMKDRTAFTLGAGQMDTRHLVGMRVYTEDGKNAGEIDHLVIDTKSGRVTHAIVGIGGLAGIGEKHVVVPWERVRIAADPKDPKDRKDMVAMIDSATLNTAMRYTRVDRPVAPAASPVTEPRRR